MAHLFNLNSPNTILWVVNNGTNKFINQDIVQTTNFDKYRQKLLRIRAENQK